MDALDKSKVVGSNSDSLFILRRIRGYQHLSYDAKLTRPPDKRAEVSASEQDVLSGGVSIS